MRFLLISLIFCYSANIYSQEPSALTFYPLHIGDKWQYSFHYGDVLQTTETSFTREVISDTMINNLEYFVIVWDKEPGVFGVSGPKVEFHRIDTVNAQVYGYDPADQTERPVHYLHLDAQEGDVFGTNLGYWCFTVQQETILGVEVTTKSFEAIGLIDEGRAFTVASGYGLIAALYLKHGGYQAFYTLTGSIVDGVQSGLISSVASKSFPDQFRLYQNYPNPFNPSTIIRYDIAQTADVEISIYNSLGEKVRTLLAEEQRKGSYNVTWDGNDDSAEPMPSGIYFYQMRATSTATSVSQSRRLLLLR